MILLKVAPFFNINFTCNYITIEKREKKQNEKKKYKKRIFLFHKNRIIYIKIVYLQYTSNE